MFKFIHTADIHLDSPLRGLERYEGAPIEQIRGAARQALKNLVRLAIEEEVQFVLIAGDLYDGDWKDYNTALFLASEMSKLREAGVKVFIISGNHDAASQITRRLKMPENVTRFSVKRPETVRLDDLGIAIHAREFPQRAVMEDLSASYPFALSGYFNIGMLHTSVTGREGHETYAPCKVESLLAKNYDYWALGHVHKREILHENPWIVFPGNIQGRHIGETGSKGCTLVTADNARIVNVEHRTVDVLEWIYLISDAAHCELPDEVVDKIRTQIEGELNKNNGPLLAVRISIQGACRAHMELMSDPQRWVNEIRAAVTDISGQSVWIEKVNIETKTAVDLEEMMKSDSPLGELLRFIQDMDSTGTLPPSFIEDFTHLKAKLPGEITQGENAINIECPEKIREVIEDVKQLLTIRLLSSRGSE